MKCICYYIKSQWYFSLSCEQKSLNMCFLALTDKLHEKVTISVTMVKGFAVPKKLKKKAKEECRQLLTLYLFTTMNTMNIKNPKH